MHYFFFANSLCVSRISYWLLCPSRFLFKFTIFSRNYYVHTLFYANSLSVSQRHLKSTIAFAKPLWIRYEITLKSIWIHYLFRDLSIKTLSASRFHYEFSVFSVNLPKIHYLFRDFTINSLSISRFHYEFTIHLANCPWIHFFSRFHFDFTISIPKSLSFSPNHYELTICFAISL